MHKRVDIIDVSEIGSLPRLSTFPQREEETNLTLLFRQVNANIIYAWFHSFCAGRPVVIDDEVVCYLVTEVKLLHLVYLSKPMMRM